MDATIIILLVTLIYLVYAYYTKKYSYWKNKNVTGPKPLPFIGNFGKIMMTKESVTMFTKKLYTEYKDEKAVGIYSGTTPMLVIRDLDMIKEVLVKNFSYFSDRGTKVSNDPLSDNLFNAEVESWRKLRNGFTPMFSSGKLKSMSPLIHSCVDEFQMHVDKLVDKDTPQEMRTLMSKYTLEVIGSCAFGLKLGALTQEDNIFREIAEIIFTPQLKSVIWRGINVIIPGIIQFLNVTITNTRITSFFQDLVKQVTNERKGKTTNRKDFMDLLIEMKERLRSEEHNKDNLSLNITDNVMAAQALVFYAAGFETSSAAMSFLLYELALNEKCQEKLYEEIYSVVKKHGEISYDAVLDMKYLDMAFDEVLRKHPPGGVLIRKCVSDYTFNGTNLKINEGDRILIPVYALHHDSKLFEKPGEFIPERFSPENKRNILPCTFLPFGDGPRNCIGMRFAKVESMMGLAGFLHKYKVELSARTKVPLEYDTKAITIKSKDGIWLNIKRR